MAVEIPKKLDGNRNTKKLIDSTCFLIKKSVDPTCFLVLVEAACFAMTIVQNYYHGLRVTGFL